MLSISNITSAKEAGNYYTAGKYYIEGQQAVDKSEWWGKGAEHLGLSGKVTKPEFQSLLDGKLPDGQQLGKIVNSEIQHRPGIDLTFSAPKSVSIMSEVAGDKRINIAHQKAVHKALGFLQSRAMQTREVVDKKIVSKNYDNMVAALFQENSSRNLDAQLHTHVVILNMILRDDGLWRSMSNEQLYWNKMIGGAIYRAELAHQLVKLGYELESYKDGMFEIKGVPEEVIKAFSSRREEIEAAILKFGYEGSYGAMLATLRTRSGKQNATQADLDEKWRGICKELGFDPGALVATIVGKPLSETKLKQLAKDAIHYGAKNLSEREAVFTVDELKREAIAYGIGYLTSDVIDKAIKNALHVGYLVADKREIDIQSRAESNAPLVTTKEMLLKEANIKQLMWQGKNTQQPFLDTAKATEELSKFRLNEGQISAVRLVLTSKDRVVGVQGYAGTGKTTMLEAIRKIMEKETSNTLVGLSPSAAAAEELQRSSKIPSQTLDSFLLKQSGKGQEKEAGNKTLIVDESSMISTQKMEKLLKLAEEKDMRVCLVGDVDQLPSVEAGKPFYQLQKAGMKTAVMNEIVRQKENEILKEAILNSIDGEVKKALKKIGDDVHVVSDGSGVSKAIEEYFSLKTKSKDALILTPSNEQRYLANEKIRDQLKLCGELKGESFDARVLVDKGETQATKTQAFTYVVGDIVRFNKNYRSLNITKGEYLKVANVEHGGKKVSLISLGDESNKIDWMPDKIAGGRSGAIELYREERRELQLGDMIRWRKNFKPEGILNNQTAKVVGIANQYATLLMSNGEKKSIELTQPKYSHWDYAYASTVHAAQGKTCDAVVALMNSNQRNLTNQKSFYTTISRARHQAILIIDSKEMLEARLEKSTGEKTSALEITSIHNVNPVQQKGGVAANFFEQFEPSSERESLENRQDKALGL